MWWSNFPWTFQWYFEIWFMWNVRLTIHIYIDGCLRINVICHVLLDFNFSFMHFSFTQSDLIFFSIHSVCLFVILFLFSIWIICLNSYENFAIVVVAVCYCCKIHKIGGKKGAVCENMCEWDWVCKWRCTENLCSSLFFSLI